MIISLLNLARAQSTREGGNFFLRETTFVKDRRTSRVGEDRGEGKRAGGPEKIVTLVLKLSGGRRRKEV